MYISFGSPQDGFFPTFHLFVVYTVCKSTEY